jgi:hypothetical protein
VTLPSLYVPAPPRRARVAVNRRFNLGVTLDGYHFGYDFDEEYQAIYLRVQCAGEDGPAEQLNRMMRDLTGIWIFSARVDEAGQQPLDIEFDLGGLEMVGPQNEVLPLAADAIALFYDNDEIPSPLHRRALRAFHRELADYRATETA